MSTTRLFDQDAYLGEFEATVERSAVSYTHLTLPTNSLV